MIPKLTEKSIETEILQWLNAQPDIFAFKINTVGIYDSVRKIYRKNKNPFIIKGTSDIIGTFRGRFLAIEVKRPGEHPTEDQKNFLNQVVKYKGIGISTCSLDSLIPYIQKLRQTN